MKTSDFRYDLPEGAIAQFPAEPRNAARLLDASTMEDHTVRDLSSLLDPGDLVVLNRTRVRRARLLGSKEGTGGRVEALLLDPIGDDRWHALVRPARRLRVGTRLRFGDLGAEIVAGPVEGSAVLRLEPAGPIEDAISAAGQVPLPPYVHEALADPERYQTVFGDRVGSAAAPTAALHLTEGVLADLEDRGIETALVDLHIGVDTFRPIGGESIEDHPMHEEWAEVGEETVRAIAAARERGARVVAVGTTVVRSLESAVASGAPAPFRGPTSLYIRPGHRFSSVDVLLTNFHVPGSTLVVLLAAFMGERWREVYDVALERGYRFLSFGDCMLVERAA